MDRTLQVMRAFEDLGVSIDLGAACVHTSHMKMVEMLIEVSKTLPSLPNREALSRLKSIIENGSLELIICDQEAAYHFLDSLGAIEKCAAAIRQPDNRGEEE